MYHKIYNPITSKWIQLNTILGKEILSKYLQIGGAEKNILEDDIHFIQEKSVRGISTKCVFFNKEHEEKWSPEYTEIIRNDPIVYKDRMVSRWFLKISDTIFFEIRRSVTHRVVPNSDDATMGTLTFNENKKYKGIFYQRDLPRFLKLFGLPELTPREDDKIKELALQYPVVLKEYNSPLEIWNITNSIYRNNFLVTLFIKKKPVAICISEIIKAEEISDYLDAAYIPNPSFNLYIARVDVHPEFQGKGLCKPVVSYMIQQLKRLGYRFLFIENASSTEDGHPACFCYYKAGVDNDYKIQYISLGDNTFHDMKLEDCYLKGKLLPRTYLYSLESIDDASSN